MIQLSKPDLSGKESEYTAEVLSSGRLAMGPFTEKFEAAFCDYLCTKYAIACSSGTVGLQICFMVLTARGKVPCNPHVVISNETFGATMNAVECVWPGTKIEPISETILGGDLYIPCHIFGLPAPDFISGGTGYNAMIEDACEALGAKHNGKYLGTFGKAGVFGFYPNKQITTGEGGMIVTDDKAFADMCRKIVNQGRLPGEPHTMIGTNARMTEMQAAIGVAQMERIDEILEKLRQVAKKYIHNLDMRGLENFRIETPMNRESWFAFPLTGGKERLQELQAYLSVKEIQSSIYFPRHECFPDFTWERRLCLPFYTQMKEEEVTEVVTVVNEWAGRQK